MPPPPPASPVIPMSLGGCCARWLHGASASRRVLQLCCREAASLPLRFPALPAHHCCSAGVPGACVQGLGINAENGAAAFEGVQRVFVEVDALLADGRPFLTGQQFTAADLTFAALAAPAVGQAYANALGLSEAMPAAMREQVRPACVPWWLLLLFC